MKIARLLIAALTVTVVAVPSSKGQEPATVETNTEASVVCSEDLRSSPEPTPYGFARATLASLWYARKAADLDKEIEKVGENTGDYSSFQTALMRLTKTSTDKFICAQRAIKQFFAHGNSKNTGISADQQKQIQIAAPAMMSAYDKQIKMNETLIDLIKKCPLPDASTSLEDCSRINISLFKDYRYSVWVELSVPVTLTATIMIDPNKIDALGKLDHLLVTKAQKRDSIAWINERYPEFKPGGPPVEQWTPPVMQTKPFIMMFLTWKCSDE